jgi:hypothetical protein
MERPVSWSDPSAPDAASLGRRREPPCSPRAFPPEPTGRGMHPNLRARGADRAELGGAPQRRRDRDRGGPRGLQRRPAGRNMETGPARAGRPALVHAQGPPCAGYAGRDRRSASSSPGAPDFREAPGAPRAAACGLRPTPCSGRRPLPPPAGRRRPTSTSNPCDPAAARSRRRPAAAQGCRGVQGAPRAASGAPAVFPEARLPRAGALPILPVPSGDMGR